MCTAQPPRRSNAASTKSWLSTAPSNGFPPPRCGSPACRANAALVNRARGADVVRVRAGSVEQALAAEAAPVDLILADPPYPLAGPPLEAVLEAAAGRLAPGGLLVLERAARDPAPRRPRGLTTMPVPPSAIWPRGVACP